MSTRPNRSPEAGKYDLGNKWIVAGLARKTATVRFLPQLASTVYGRASRGGVRRGKRGVTFRDAPSIVKSACKRLVALSICARLFEALREGVRTAVVMTAELSG